MRGTRAALALLAVLPFLPSVLTGELLGYDDDHYVFRSRAIAHAEVGRILDPRASRADLGEEYLPVRDLTYVLDASLWGVRALYDEGPERAPPDDPRWTRAARGFRATSLVLYALACVLAFELLARTTGDRLLAFVAAALFAVHPVHAESVAWIASRKDVLSGALGLAALLLHGRAFAAPGSIAWPAFGGALLLGALAMLSKSTLTCLPLLVLLLEVAGPLVRAERSRLVGAPAAAHPAVSWRRALARSAPWFLLAGAVGWNAVSVGARTGIVRPAAPGGLATVVATDLPILVRYLAASFAPFDLRVSQGGFPLRSPGDRQVLVAGGTLLLVAAAALAAARRRPKVLGFAAAWFLCGLAPVLNLVPVVQWIADRYLFLPVLGPCLAAAWLVVRLRRARGTGPLLAFLGLAVLGALSVARGLDFTTGERLFRQNVRLEPGNAIAHHELGRALLARASSARRKGDEPLAAAVARGAELEEALALAIFGRQPGVQGYGGPVIEARRGLARALELQGDLVAYVRVERETLLFELRQGRPDAWDALAALGNWAVSRTRDERDAPLMLEAARCFARAGKAGLARAAVARVERHAPALAADALDSDPVLRKVVTEGR